ncbi:MAG: hypothetical protein GF393_04855 [Armatimonadia bacterium]|nr:hypothetical protein [Armatimonadia bacterium]
MEIDRELALQYLGDCLYGAILGQAGAVRPSDLVRSLPQGMRLGVGLIRELLSEDSRFEEVAGRFDIVDRETAKTRPFGGAVAALLEGYGRPVPVSLMVSGLARIRGGSPDYFAGLLDNYEGSRRDVVYAADHVVHAEWILRMEGEDEEQVLFYNRLDGDEDLREMWERCEEDDLRKRDPGLTAANILAELARPISPRQLAFLTWTHHPQIFDPVEFVAEVLERDDVIPACGMWFGEDQIAVLHDELRNASDEISGDGEEAPHIDLAEILENETPSTPYKLDPDDRTNIMSVISSTQVPIGLDELVVDLLEIAPDNKRFISAVHAIHGALSGEEDLIEVSPGRYLSRQAIPDWIHEVPEPLIPVQTDSEDDVLIELQALPEPLQEEVRDPIYEDICSGVELEPDEDLGAADSIDYPLLHHHYIMGTMAVRRIDRQFFASEPALSLLVVRFGESEAHPVWLNTELGLLFGLSRLYERHLPPSGGVFRITRGEAPETCVLEYDGDTEADLTPEEDRMSVLERKRERVSHRPISTRDLMLELLEEHDDGLSFNELWAEMNVVRRTSRWQIASLLAYHPCFSESDGRWDGDRALATEPGDEGYAEFVVREEEEEAEDDEDVDEGAEDADEDE